MKAPLPENEDDRLTTLRRYDVLDTAAEPEFDDLAVLAAQICQVPTAVVSFVDEGRQWFKSRIGFELTETPRDVAFCAHTILHADAVMEISDAQTDPRFFDNPLVAGDPHIRFYAGAPLVAPDGHTLGALCVIDRTPRMLTSQQLAALRALSRHVVAQLELRRQARALTAEIAERKRGEIRMREQFEQLEANEQRISRLLDVAERSRLALLGILEDEKRAQASSGASAALIKDVINSLTAHVVVLDVDGKIIETNAAWKMFAAQHAALNSRGTDSGANYLEVCDAIIAARDEANAPTAADGIRAVLSGAAPDFIFEYPCHCAAEQRWFVMRVMPLTGHRRGVVVAHENITQRKLAELTLRESEERFRRLIENATDVITVVNAIGQVEFQSPSTERVLGYAPPDMLGRAVLEFIHPEDREKATAAIVRALDSSALPVPIEYRIRHRDDTWRIFQSIGRVMSGTAGEKLIVVNSRDVTETRKLEDQFRQAQKMEAIGTLAGGIAHDFNNVLAAIVGYTELAKSESKHNPEVLEYLKAVSEGSSRATALVGQILAFSRQQEQQRKPVRLGPILEEALKLLRATIPSTIQFDASVIRRGTTVLADPTQIHQVIMNLATNSAHAMKDRPGRLGLTLETVQVDAALCARHPGLRLGRYVRLGISDTGHGMDKITLSRIFDPFFTTKAPGEGTGLGLAVVHGIMQSHEGVITVTSQPGEGTRFQLYFPAHTAEMAEGGIQAVETPRGRGERILLIDDEASLAFMGKRVLERLGYIVDTRTVPAEAVAEVRAEPKKYDLVVTDLTMPGMTGIELSRLMLSIRPGLPIILTTGYSATLTPERVMELGIREMLLKPLTMQGLGEGVHRVLTAKNVN